MTFRVLVVEDEALAAEAHAAYVGRLPAFELAGVARSAREATALLHKDGEIDLVLMDLHLPDGHGLTLLRHLRAAGQLCDVIAVTSARDLDVVRQAVAQGVVSYLLKPFTFASLRDKLLQYADYRRQVTGGDHTQVAAQHDVDRVLATLRAPGRPAQPKGMSEDTLAAVVRTLQAAPGELSAAEVADDIGVSRVTARRYLKHLASQRLASRSPRYGGAAGRPEYRYRWRT